MAYTQSVLQSELSKQREASGGWPWRLMTLALVVLVTVIAVYLGMRFGFQGAYLKSQLEKSEADVATITASVSLEEQKQILNFYSQLSNIDALIDRQGKGVQYLELIEKNTLKAVVYTSMDMTIGDKMVVLKLDGRTMTYGSIVQQMDLYKKVPSVSGVKLSGARLAGQAADGITFSIELTVNR